MIPRVCARALISRAGNHPASVNTGPGVQVACLPLLFADYSWDSVKESRSHVFRTSLPPTCRRRTRHSP